MLQLDDCRNKLAKFKHDLGLKYGLIRIGIFGSVARKENTDNSDIDIVVELEKPSLYLMYDLKENLKKLFECEVDLVRFRDSLRPMLKNNIQNEAIYV
ncbi:MAG: nucleotidyltransferase domain-containing protein [Bacteroides sp.]|nr:nucleotidyltransferase domain-containing protein [Bacteroides sp.]